jgi:hypothetical protein
MAKLITKQGPARKLGQQDSRKITRAVNRSMLRGASKREAGVTAPELRPPRRSMQIGAETETATNAEDDWRSSIDGSEDFDRASMVTDERGSMTDIDDFPSGGMGVWNKGSDVMHFKHGCAAYLQC